VNNDDAARLADSYVSPIRNEITSDDTDERLPQRSFKCAHSGKATDFLRFLGFLNGACEHS
jgi:hypothetical protein